MKESILRPVKRVFGGAYLSHHKNTAEAESVLMPPPPVVKIPLQQHIGAPCQPVVAEGEKVFVGTVIGKTSNFVSAPIHASVSGIVKKIAECEINGSKVQCVIIESDGKMTKAPTLKPCKISGRDDIVMAARNCGLVGLGGAGFPTHVKLAPSDNAEIDTLIVNGAECEPYITSDYRECVENYDDVIEGIYLLKDKLGIKKVVIGVESNKPKAIKKLYRIAADHRDADDSVKLMKLPSCYPQGAEKVIIYSATGRALPPGKLPSDVGCMVMNITSVGTLYRYISTGMPLVAKRITVDGDAVKEPKNIIVPIGTSVKEVLEFAGGICEGPVRILAGGPMMGQPIFDTEAVIEKRNNAILVLKDKRHEDATPCIRCGRCAFGCPMNLYPASVESAINHGLNDRLQNLNVDCCMECGICSYVCPAKRPLTQVMRVAKSELRRQK